MELSLEYTKDDAHRDALQVLQERFGGVELIRGTWDTTEKFVREYTKYEIKLNGR